MLYDVRIEGETPIIQHSSDGLLPGNAATKEIKTITSKRGTNRTESDEARLQQLETLNSLWRNGDTVTVPPQAIRARTVSPSVPGMMVGVGCGIEALDWDLYTYAQGYLKTTILVHKE